MRNMFKIFLNNRGFALVPGAEAAAGAAEVDTQDLLYAQAMEEIAADAEGREPKDLLSTPKKKKDDEGDGESGDKSGDQADGGDDGEADKGKDKKADKKAGEEGSEGEDAQGDEAGDKEGEDGEKAEEGDDATITTYAEKHKMTYAEAKEDIEKTAEIVKQYKSNPAEMARAMRNKDREYQKLRADAAKAAAKKEPIFKRKSDEEFRDWARAAIEKQPEAIENFRKRFPGKSESMSDAAVIEEVVEQGLGVYHQKAAEKETEIKDTAAKKRETMIASIPEKDRRFIPTVKVLLLDTDDESILNDSVDVQTALDLAKGAKYDVDVNAAYARGVKAGKEGATIVGTKGSSGSGSKPSVKKGGHNLNDKQKAEAVRMYGNNYEDDECYKLFRETYEEELKKDPNFVR